MKYFMVLGLVGFLFTSGCKEVSHTEHQIVCTDPQIQSVTYNVTTPENVVALVAEGHSVLAYYDDNHKTHLIFLAQNSCVIH